jgi:hypothetical protein
LGFIILLGFSLPVAWANTKVAFLEQYDERGRLIQYEPGGRFAHSAIEVDGLWLQAYPGEGVQLVTWNQLQRRGKIVLLEIPVNVSLQQVKPYLGQPFDFEYSWGDQAFYCSELLGKILGIPPQPMHFNHAVWPKSYWKKEGSPGLSPDRIYQYLKEKYSL